MKKVLIVSRREIRKNKPINWVSEIYLQLLAEAELIPLIVPIAPSSENNYEHYLNDYDGMLMVEGGDISPSYYGENYPMDELDEIDELKDIIEFACLKHAIENKKPILGFCRGMHLINVFFGGSLHKDIHKHNKNKVLHINYNNYDNHRHSIKIEKNTPLHNWYKLNEISVNTYHHQGINNLAKPLKAMAFSNDELIEGIYHPGFNFLAGLQFHPERMYNDYDGNKAVFKSYFNAVKHNTTIFEQNTADSTEK